MADRAVLISHQFSKPIRILKWKVSQGNVISIGRVMLLFNFDGSTIVEQRKLKSTQAGTVHRLIAQEGAIVKRGDVLLELNPCIHPTVMNDMCAECGADLRKDDLITTASIPMVHSIPELKVSEELAQKLGKADGDRLLRDRKLVLLVDLDQTIIHTTNDNIPPNIRDVYHFQLYGPASPWYHTRLRPGTHKFLDNVSSLYELHICTFGARNYAHTITMLIDRDQTYFSNRILSRDECFDPTSKKANLKALFPCGDNMVCIIDDREDVWSHALNLIHVKPYHFFQHTGDINAPPGLDKFENDEKDSGVDWTKRTKKLAIENNKNNSDEKEEGMNNGSNKEEKECEDVNNETISDNKETEDVCKNNGKILEDVENLEKECKEEVKEEEKQDNSNNTNKKDDEFLDIEDPDDYLLFLEDILKKIHVAFYHEYDRMQSGLVPDLKQVIPAVKAKVLEGCNLVFSGLVPTHIKLISSRAYQVARSLGANVTQDLQEDTTHLVAVRPGTAKVNAGRRRKNIKIVTPDWLWTCAERWEHVDEVIYPLNRKGSKNRHPPPHCSSPVHVPAYPTPTTEAAPVLTLRKRTPSGRFMDTINPLMSFSSDDIADMDKEVEDMLDGESDDSDEDKSGQSTRKRKLVTNTATGTATVKGDDKKPVIIKKDVRVIVEEDDPSSSSSAESLTGEYPRGFKRIRREMRGKHKLMKTSVLGVDMEDDDDLGEVDSSLDEFPSTKFRRGEELGSDLEIGGESNSEGSVEPPDEMEDGEWNMMGAALEREFLANN